MNVGTTISGVPSAAYALTDNTKGSIGNRIDCGKEQIANTAKASIKGTGVALGLGAATGLAATSKHANKFVQVALDKIKQTDTYKTFAPQAKELVKKGIDAFKKLPGSTKAIALAGGGLALLSSYIIDKQHSFKAGQIDQKYTDKAELQKIVK